MVFEKVKCKTSALKYHVFTSFNEELNICVGTNKSKNSKCEKLQGIKIGSEMSFKCCMDDIGKT